MFSEREMASPDTCILDLPHSGHRGEIITIATLSDVSKRPVVHFPPLFTAHTPKAGSTFSSGIFPWLICSK